MAREFSVGEHSYITERMNLFSAMHVARLCAPVAPSIAAVVSVAKVEDDAVDPLEIIAAVEPLMQMLSEMAKENVDFIMNECMATVKRRIAGDRGWQPILAGPGVMQFSDITPFQAMVIVKEVLTENVGPFIEEGLSALKGVLADKLNSSQQASPTTKAG